MAINLIIFKTANSFADGRAVLEFRIPQSLLRILLFFRLFVIVPGSLIGQAIVALRECADLGQRFPEKFKVPRLESAETVSWRLVVLGHDAVVGIIGVFDPGDCGARGK